MVSLQRPHFAVKRQARRTWPFLRNLLTDSLRVGKRHALCELHIPIREGIYHDAPTKPSSFFFKVSTVYRLQLIIIFLLYSLSTVTSLNRNSRKPNNLNDPTNPTIPKNPNNLNNNHKNSNWLTKPNPLIWLIRSRYVMCQTKRAIACKMNIRSRYVMCQTKRAIACEMNIRSRYVMCQTKRAIACKTSMTFIWLQLL